MSELVLGIMAAVGASTLYSLGVALQAMDAKRTPQREYLRLGLAWNLIKRGRWLLGTGLSLLGWPLQLLALSLAPLVVVQPAMAAGLLVLLVIGERMLGERAGRREHLAVGAIVVGVLGAALCAPPHTDAQSSDTIIAIVLSVLGLASLLPYIMLRFARRPPAMLTIVGAGLAYGWTGVATKLASDNLAYGFIWVAVAWGLATAAVSAIAALSEMSALQSRPAIQVAPVVFVIQTAVPVALAPVLLGEHFTETPLSGAPLAVSLAILLVGAVMLARSPLLLALMEVEPAGTSDEAREGEGAKPASATEAPDGEAEAADAREARDAESEPAGPPAGAQRERVSAASGSAESPSAPSQETTRSTPSTEAPDPSTPTTRTSPARVGR
jgi:drug/metabolite transporter (DMT)-like permease